MKIDSLKNREAPSRMNSGFSLIEFVVSLALLLTLTAMSSYPLRKIRESVALRQVTLELHSLLNALQRSSLLEDQPLNVIFDDKMGRVFQQTNLKSSKQLVFSLPQGISFKDISVGTTSDPNTITFYGNGIVSPCSIAVTDNSGSECKITLGLRGSEKFACGPRGHL